MKTIKLDHVPTKRQLAILVEDLHLNHKNMVEIIESGFITDGGSIIWFLAWLLKPFGQHLAGFIGHDFDYQAQSASKWKADMKLLWRMKHGTGNEIDIPIKFGMWKPANSFIILVTFIYLNTFGWAGWLRWKWSK